MDNLDFLNLNSLRNYPVKDGLSRCSVDGLFTIPNDFIVDMSVSAPDNANLSLYISKIVNTVTGINVEIRVADLDVIGTFNIPVAGTSNNQDFTMVPSVSFPRAIGTITIGTLDTITTQASGEFFFDQAATELLMRVYSPATSGLNYLRFTDNKGNQVTLTGYVNVLAESNLQFRDAGDGQTVIMDAGENLGLNKKCDTDLMPIKTINGIRPDTNGNFQIIETACIKIPTTDYGIIIQDTCGKPCLGCTEIGQLTDRLVSVESDLLTVRNYVNNLQNALTQLTTIINNQCERG